MSQDEWVRRFKEKHGDLYVYSEVTYKNGTATANYFCEHHGYVEQNAQLHVSRSGCPACGNQMSGVKQRLSQVEWLERFTAAHGSTYNYLEVVYSKGGPKVSYLCPNHGSVVQSAKHHADGVGCPACAIKRAGEAQTFSLEDWSSKFKKVHGERYEYLDLVRDSATYILYRCPEHGERLQVCTDHAKGFGCPKCTPGGSYGNKHTKEIVDYVASTGLTALEEHSFDGSRKRWDVVVPEARVAIEFDGIYYHSEKFKPNHSNMLDKAMEASASGYRQLNIFEDEWYEKKAIVKRLIASACGKSPDATVYARKTIAVALDLVDVKPFLEANHIQGFAAGSHYIGLKNGESLVACMVYSYKSAGRSTTKVQSCVDIQRYATSCRVVGGFQKLMKQVLLDEEIQTIISYSDPRLFSGGMYAKAGFTASPEGAPDYCYVRSSKRIPKRARQKSWFKDREGVLYDPTLTEYELALLNGYQRLWFRGKVKWTWTRPPAQAFRRQAGSAPTESASEAHKVSG
jgi:hypothetical protein